MSAAQTMLSRLKALQCHFTWDLGLSRSLPSRCRDNLLDIGTENGNRWLGHIYNLRGFIQYRLGFSEDAQSFFNKAKQAFCKIKAQMRAPESEAYLYKIDALNKKYPSPSQEELHPETYAEKAYALMTVSGDKTLVVDYFQRAIEMQPGIREWNTSHALALMYASKHSRTGLEDDILEKMRIAQEQDPDNLYLAAHYLDQRAQRGERIEDEAQEALKNHPDERYLKRCVTLCYKWKIISPKQSRPEKSMIDRAILLLEEKEIHLETLAGKTYTLMMFNGDIKLVADYFQRAIEMQPDMVEWNSWPVLALVYASKHSRTGLEDDILEKMRIAQEQDPENLYLAAHYLDQRAQRGERIEDEAPFSNPMTWLVCHSTMSGCILMALWKLSAASSILSALNFIRVQAFSAQISGWSSSWDGDGYSFIRNLTLDSPAEETVRVIGEAQLVVDEPLQVVNVTQPAVSLLCADVL
ncbi:hypothetical protein F7725_028114 [Dissostichus mawsoni]|uniref:Uncharacterized protein n=1 Tax=Dissostichus mawsoni TaxID=36200 RepID=A0A7J5XER9_DISMA|nr:hypothetical protein F7725_028114 [Dissostichus mawsoni]